MSYFSSDAFLDALAQVHFAKRRCEKRLYSLNGVVYRLLSVDGEPIVDWPFLDFIEPVGPREPIDPGEPSQRNEATSGAPLPLRFIPRAAVGRQEVAGGKPTLPPFQQPAPYVDFTQLTTWEAVERHIGERRSKLLSDSAKREKKLSAALGSVTFELHDTSDAAFEQCRAWKSAQYIATGGTDAFFQENIPLFRELIRRDALKVSTLRAGGKLLAVSWSASSPGRLGYWVPAYDPEQATYSPGRLLLHRVLAEVQRSGYRELDLLIGDEEYKWYYATHMRVVAPVGRPPWKLRARMALAKYPRVREAARWAKRTLVGGGAPT